MPPITYYFRSKGGRGFENTDMYIYLTHNTVATIPQRHILRHILRPLYFIRVQPLRQQVHTDLLRRNYIIRKSPRPSNAEYYVWKIPKFTDRGSLESPKSCSAHAWPSIQTPSLFGQLDRRSDHSFQFYVKGSKSCCF